MNISVDVVTAVSVLFGAANMVGILYVAMFRLKTIEKAVNGHLRRHERDEEQQGKIRDQVVRISAILEKIQP